jgi:hypothetical protein
MAEFIDNPEQQRQRASDALTADGMAAFGKPVPTFRKTAALMHCRELGLSDTNKATGMVNRMVDAIERDEPYAAMEAGTAYLDLTGTYRLLAVLCTAEEDRDEPGAIAARVRRSDADNEKNMIYSEWGF